MSHGVIIFLISRASGKTLLSRARKTYDSSGVYKIHLKFKLECFWIICQSVVLIFGAMTIRKFEVNVGE